MSPADWSGPLVYLAAFAGGYTLGSIPFGLILAKLAGLGDLRQIGSGNIGATNVLRAGSKGLAALTLLLDAAKGTAAVLIAASWGENAAMLAGLGAFLGHLFPVWLGFRGGKLDRRRGRRTPQNRRKRLEDVAGACDKASALLQEIIGARRARIERAAGYGKHFAPLFASEASCDQRA